MVFQYRLCNKDRMGPAGPPVVAQPLDSGDPDLPEKTQDILEKGKRGWLKNTEVCDMLLHHAAFNLRVAKEPPRQPPGSCLTTSASIGSYPR